MDQIVSGFSPTSTDAFDIDSLISTVADGLSMGGDVAKKVPGVSQLSDAVGGLNTVIQFLNQSAANEYPSSSDIETALEGNMATIYRTTYQSISDIVAPVFVTNEFNDNLPVDASNAPFKKQAANYLYQAQPLFEIDAETWMTVTDTVNTTIKQSLVGVPLGQTDYYFLKNGARLDYCNEVGHYVVNGNCYQLANPGSGGCRATYGSSQIASQDIITKLEQGYGVNMTAMILSSEACQSETNTYYGKLPVGITHSDSFPPCFWNLPVFTIRDDPSIAPAGYPPELDSPCAVADSNFTSHPGPLVVSQNYLPDNIYKFFSTTTQCTCEGINPQTVTICKRTMC